MRKKYCDQESVFAHIWNNADRDGLWIGDGASLGEQFGVSADESHAALTELCDRDRIQRVGNSTYIVTRWPERDKASDEE